MKKKIICSLLLIVFIVFAFDVFAETIDVRIKVRQDKDEENIVTRENLIKIQGFILSQGERESYCNMYSNNPAYKTMNYRFYLNPDTGQENINCDPKKSDFHNLTIRKVDRGKNQYRTVEFINKNFIYISSNWPTDDLTVDEIYKLVADAMEEIMGELKE
jgi:hypothetical protein